MAKFVITEEQYNKLMEWGGTDSLSLSSDKTNKTTIEVQNNSGDPGQEVNNTAKKLGNPQDVKYVVSGKRDTTNSQGEKPAGSTSVFENARIITKKELTENHFNRLRENSKLYTVKDFLRK